ncbi:MAG: hypothetical protein GF346_07405 [Candidatus Eisenbacteria bacterium]|nr:hypothetical protein [Candidatus Latescibacterota bacterium]MBD3302258.1 hypothetical protein [Candidatus Eisenbacteria bacterium]
MQNKKQWFVKMVHPKQIAAKKFPGCATPQSVQNFCTRYNINRFWWKPPEGSKKMLMVDFDNFWNSYQKVYGDQWSQWNNPSRRTTGTRSTTSSRSGSTNPRTRNYRTTQRTYSRKSNTRRAA